MKKNYSKGIDKILITGGLGFIGSNYIIKILENTNIKILNVDKDEYASSHFGIEECLKKIGNEKSKNYKFYKFNLINSKEIANLLNQFKPDLIVNFAAESHVDRSIDNPKIFIENNVLGTFYLLESTRSYFSKLSNDKKKNLDFIILVLMKYLAH